MLRNMCKSKIHRARVTEANLNYVGSITVDRDLMDAADIIPYEMVQVVDINNGARLETYVIPGERGRGDVCLNGAAARLVHPGDLVIIMASALMEEQEARSLSPRVVFVDGDNKIVEISNEEKHGEIR